MNEWQELQDRIDEYLMVIEDLSEEHEICRCLLELAYDMGLM